MAMMMMVMMSSANQFFGNENNHQFFDYNDHHQFFILCHLLALEAETKV